MALMADNLFLQTFSRRRIWSVAEGRVIFQSWMDLVPQLTPELCGPTEPVRQPFTLDTLLANWSSWSSMFIALRRRPTMLMMVDTDALDRHSSLKVSMDEQVLAGGISIEALTQFLKTIVGILGVDFALLHLLTEHEIPDGLASDAVAPFGRPGKPSYSVSVNTHVLRRYIPQLYWATVLGAPYVRLFGRATLLSAPTYLVEELPDGAIYLQLSESPLDLQPRRAEVDAALRAVQAHLNHNAFFNRALHPAEQDFTGYSIPEIQEKMERWYGAHRYDVPVFEFERA
jgi:hypothetical protein